MSKLRKAAARALPQKYKDQLRRAVHPAQRVALARLLGKGDPDVGLLTVVIPVYNVEAYIAECLTSVISQSYMHIEIIVVDDGSTDASMEIVAGFAKYDRRISIISLENGGNGRARNVGVAAATGEYLTFADSDDVVAPGAYALMMAAIIKSGSDFVVGSSMRLIGRKLQKTKISSLMHARERIGITIDVFPEILDDVFFWNKVFRRSFWDSSVAPIPEDVLYEDQETTARAYVRAKGFDVLEEVVYFWRQRNDGSSITQGKRTHKDLSDRMAVADHVTALLLSESTPQVVEKWFARLFGSDLVPYYGQIPYTDDKYWSVLSSGVEALSQLMADNDSAMDRLPILLDPHSRVMLSLAATGMKDELEQVVVDRMEVGTGYEVELVNGRFYARPNYWNSLPVLSNTPLLECDPALLDMDTQVVARGWTDSGELRLSGHGFVRGLADHIIDGPIVIAVKATDGTWSQLAVESAVDENLDAKANDAFASHTTSAFTSLVPPTMLSATEDSVLRIRVGFKVSDQEFERHHTIAVSDGRSDPAMLAPQVCGFAVNSETEEFSVDVQWGAGLPAAEVYLSTKNHRLDPGIAHDLGGNVTRYEFILAQEFWGRKVSAPHSGAYTLRYNSPDKRTPTNVGRTLMATPDFTWTVPIDYRLKHAHVQGWVTSAGRFAVTIAAPLGDNERGKYWQRHLQKIFSYNDGVLNDHIVFESFGGKFCTDSPRALSDELHARNPGKEIYWSIEDFSVSFPGYSKPLIRGTKEWFEKVSGASLLINNNNFPFYFRKTDGQFYLQTWHGTPMKKIGLDAPTRYLSPSYRRLMVREAACWDLLLAQNEFSRDVFSTAFGYTGPILVEGYPRNDLLLTSGVEEKRGSIRSQLGISDKQNVVLYAPTWRDQEKGTTGNYRLVDRFDFKKAHQVLGDGTVFLMRGHHNVLSGKSPVSGKNVIDVSDYPEINDLILASDALITDYSSIMFDYSSTGKPILFLTTDIEEYATDVRGFYISHDHTGLGKKYLSFHELLRDLPLVTSGNNTLYAPKNVFSITDDGKASGRVISTLDRYGTALS